MRSLSTWAAHGYFDLQHQAARVGPATEPGLASSVRKTPLTTRQEYRLEQIRGLTCSTRQPATEPGLASSVRKTPLTTRQEYRLEQIRGLAWGQLPEAQGNRVAISMYGCSKARAVRMLVTASELRLDSNSLEHSFKADSAPIRVV